MNCRDFQADIGLFVENDLPVGRVRRLERHFAVCAGCTAFAEELRESQSEIRQIRHEIIDSTVLQRIRAGVLAEIQAIESRRTWLDRFGIRFWGALRLRSVLTACFVIMIVGSIWYWQHSRLPITMPARVTVAEVHATAPPPVQSVVATSHPVAVHHQRKVTRAKVPAVVTPREDVLVQMQTEDPNVVIYWLIDQNTGGN